MAVSAKKVRAARQFLRKNARAGSVDISPARFARAARAENLTFARLLDLIRYYYAHGDERERMRHDILNKRTSSSSAPA